MTSRLLVSPIGTLLVGVVAEVTASSSAAASLRVLTTDVPSAWAINLSSSCCRGNNFGDRDVASDRTAFVVFPTPPPLLLFIVFGTVAFVVVLVLVEARST